MGKIDEIKEELGWLKVIFGITVAIAISLIGWLATHYDTAHFEMLLSATIGVLILTLVIIIINKKAYKKIRELRDL